MGHIHAIYTSNQSMGNVGWFASRQTTTAAIKMYFHRIPLVLKSENHHIK